MRESTKPRRRCWDTLRHWWTAGARREELLVVNKELARVAHEERSPVDACAILARAVGDAIDLIGTAVYRRAAATDPWELVAACGQLTAPHELSAAPYPTGGRIGASSPILAVSSGDAYPTAPTTWGAHAVAPRGTTLIALGHRRNGRALSALDVGIAMTVAAHLDVLWQVAALGDTLRRQVDDCRRLEQQLVANTIAEVEPSVPIDGFPEIIGRSPVLQRALLLVDKVAASASSVLITGETGTGKELIARAIHARSDRREGPLVSVNCPAIPHHLAESELFGHERGAFTDAIDARPGKFELADGGTVFLDEIAELPLPLQVKLLRVLQEREIQRLGARKSRRLDIRIVAATNRDLRAEMPHAFRDDLYYRLATVTIDVPALRERADDIPVLATHFATAAASAAGKRILGFTGRALAMLRSYHWPGNVRELRNVIDRAVLLCAGDTIRPEHLTGFDACGADSHSLSHIVREEKVRRVRDALHQSNGNQAAAARLLGMSRSNFGRLLKSLGLKTPATPADEAGMREVG